MTEFNIPKAEPLQQTTEIGSIWSPTDRDRAAHLALAGQAIGVYNRGVDAIWGNGANPNFPAAVRQIKGEGREGRPLAATLTTAEFISLIDSTQIPKDLQGIFLEAEEVAARLGSLCFVRAPITAEAAQTLPKSMISQLPDGTPVLQNWDAQGHKPTALLLKRMRELGIRFPAVTSMNVSGQPERVTQEEGIAFSQEHSIPMFLIDPQDQQRALGSYTIIGIGRNGVELVRDGNIKGTTIARLLDMEILPPAEGMKTIEYEQYSAPNEYLSLKPTEARIAILADLRNVPDERKERIFDRLSQRQ